MAESHAPKPMAVHCPTCDATAVCEPHGYVINAPHPSEGVPERWKLLACPNHHALLVVQEDFGPGLRFDDQGPFRIYPPQDRPLSNEIPDDLREAHEEARRCFRSKAWTGTVAMCGRTLEGACKLHGITERDLRRSLAKMKEHGLIDGRLWDWARNPTRGPQCCRSLQRGRRLAPGCRGRSRLQRGAS